MTCLNHLAVGVTDMDKSGQFYDSFLHALGYQSALTDKQLRTWTGPDGVSEVLLHPDGDYAQCRHTHVRPGEQATIFVEDRATVNAAHSATLSGGWTILHEPRERRHPSPCAGESYAVVVADPDKIRWEVVFTPTPKHGPFWAATDLDTVPSDHATIGASE